MPTPAVVDLLSRCDTEALYRLARGERFCRVAVVVQHGFQYRPCCQAITDDDLCGRHNAEVRQRVVESIEQQRVAEVRRRRAATLPEGDQRGPRLRHPRHIPADYEDDFRAHVAVSSVAHIGDEKPLSEWPITPSICMRKRRGVFA